MIQRDISQEEVETALAEYHTVYTDPKGNPIYIGRPGGRRIKVVVRRGSDPPHVITVAD